MSLSRVAPSSVKGAAARSRAEAMHRIIFTMIFCMQIRYNVITSTIDLVVMSLVLHGFCATIPASEDLSIDTRWPLSLGRGSICQDGTAWNENAPVDAGGQRLGSWDLISLFTFMFSFPGLVF